MYLIDTNILIYHFNQSIPNNSKDEIREIFINHFNISVITQMEFLGFKGHTEESFSKAKSFLSYAKVIQIEEDIVNTVIQLKRERKLKLPDAIIAATALNNDFTLITRNVDDFKRTDLKIFNPFSD